MLSNISQSPDNILHIDEIAGLLTITEHGDILALESLLHKNGYGSGVSPLGILTGTEHIEETAATVDILGGLSQELVREYITAIRQFSYADGTVIIELAFKGDINEMETMGTGEIILNEEGYIISQKFDLQAEVTVDGIPAVVRQSAECVLMNYGDSVSAVDFPDLSTYSDATILQEAN